MASRGSQHVRDERGFLVENPPASTAAPGPTQRKDPDLRPVAYRFPPELIERLRKAAYELRETQTELVRQSVDKHLSDLGY